MPSLSEPFTRRRKHPISNPLFKLYTCPAKLVLRHPRIVIGIAVLIVLVTTPVYPQTEWRAKARWYSNWPHFIKPAFRPFWPDTISSEELVNEIIARLAL